MAGALEELKKHPAEQNPSDVDKSALETAVQSASKLQKDKYTQASWRKFQSAFDNAANILTDHAATQDQVDAAVTALEAAINGLEKVPEENGGNGNPGSSDGTNNGGTTGNNGSVGTDKNNNSKTGKVKTGDISSFGIYAGIMLAALAAVLGCVVRIVIRRRRSK